MPPSDRAIEEWASERHGIVTLAELEILGLGGRGVRHRVSSGRLHRVHRGVYSVERPRRRGLWMAAVCAAGPGAVLSHRSAAELSGLIVDSRPPISVTVPHAASLRQREGVAIHCSTSLAPEDLTEVDGIPCTAYARTLLDLASEVDRRALVRAIERAESLRQFDLDAILRVVARNRGRRGTRKLVAALDGWTEPVIARSAAEE